MAEITCKHFSGYKPCGLNAQCDSSCPSRSIPKHRVLLIHLDNMGAVLRSTALLPAIHRKYPNCHITWVTRPHSSPLLMHSPLIDKVIHTNVDGLLELSAMAFDDALVIDKSLAAIGILKHTTVKRILGFTSQPGTNAIVPATPAAQELWEIGLSDHKKFFENQKTETQLNCEALELEYERDPYSVRLTDAENLEAAKRRQEWLLHSKFIVGINTGCSPIIPYKKLTTETHHLIVQELRKMKGVQIVLLGGPEDTERNQDIAHGTPAILSPTDKGLRDGLISVAACDIVITGDSLGMHMAIALQKYVIAWFGPTCAHEIDLYDRGQKLLADVPCSPCWKRSCNKSVMCYDQVNINEIIAGVNQGIAWQTSSFKQPLSETHFSPSL